MFVFVWCLQCLENSNIFRHYQLPTSTYITDNGYKSEEAMMVFSVSVNKGESIYNCALEA